ncbi:heme/hemin ABC transporter substrate-binding protein [Plantibacter sp. Mn2098]|uniref:heme/hemin ABC transporter substrate-binding protein n=1 Tax=Plantibacter sp. Mn2098 TaxID=3395266 RepID=UPI003BC7BC61
MNVFRPARARRTIVAAAIAVIAIALTACSPGTGTSGSGGAGHGGETAGGCGSTAPLSELTPVKDPKNWEGPTTACMNEPGITPVAKHVKSSLPVTVTDNQGTQVTITDTSRILALDLYGSLAATVFGLGLGDNVVGRDTSTGFPEAAKLPLVTQNGHELNGEAILALNPSVIITDSSIGPWDVILQMRESGIPVVVLTPQRSLDNIDDLVTQVAAALGVAPEGELLNARIQKEVSTTIADIAKLAPANPADRPRVMFFYVRGNAGIYYIFGEGSGADVLIQSLDAVDVAGEIGWKGMRPMTAEAIIDAKPDVLIMMTKGLESIGGVDGLLERIPAIAQTPAGQHRRIIDMNDTEVMSFGPRTSAVLDALARALYAPDQAAK